MNVGEEEGVGGCHGDGGDDVVEGWVMEGGIGGGWVGGE